MAGDIHSILRDTTPQIEAGLRRYAWPEGATNSRLRAAMDYSLFAGGKRLRPLLVLLACRACGGRDQAAMPVACAFEMVHTYSLIHDDLPAMDNDDFRRGRPTCHKEFDDATAILAGDAMLTYAFRLLAVEVQPAERAVRLVRLLADAAGLAGMVSGQMADLEAEGRSDLKLPDLEAIHRGKTGALIAAAVVAGGICAGAGDALLATLDAFGKVIGHAFQVADDILDQTATAEALGKSPGKDLQAGKLTYPGLLGLDGARHVAQDLARKAHVLGRDIPDSSGLLALADFFVERSS